MSVGSLRFGHERQTHEGDSALYVRLAMAAMDINEMCLRTKQDVDRVGLVMSTAMLDIEMHREAHRITVEQRDRLMSLLKDGLDDARDVLPFPSPDYEPPDRAA